MKIKWRPYRKFTGALEREILHIDRQIFFTRALMIYYWIAKRHPTQGVMKQFDLAQEVPPEFILPYERIDIAHKSQVDYRFYSNKFLQYIAEWSLWLTMLTAAPHDPKHNHTNEYFQWYKTITRLIVGKDKPSSGAGAQIVHELEDAIEILKANEDEENKTWIMIVKKKLSCLQKACAKGFNKFTLETYSSTSLGEEEQLDGDGAFVWKVLFFYTFILLFIIFLISNV